VSHDLRGHRFQWFYVEWEDPSSHDTWLTAEDVDAMEPILAHTTAIVLRRGPRYLVLCSTVADVEGVPRFSGIVCIPRACIRKLKRVKGVP